MAVEPHRLWHLTIRPSQRSFVARLDSGVRPHGENFMTEHNIKPERITKPIQLLGAWLAGLFSIDTAFLLTATRMPDHSWEAGTLVVASVVNVPLFLLAVFVLQTKFRPELQEDSYYSTYLSQRTNEPVIVSRDEQRVIRLQEQLSDIEKKLTPAQEKTSAKEVLDGLVFGINKHLADKEQIVEKLSKAGVSTYTTFGVKEAPSERVVSISQHLSKQEIRSVLSLMRELGFERYNLYDNLAEETEEDVLIGSYGSGNRILTG